MEEIEKEIRIEQSREHVCFNRSLFMMSCKEIFVDSEGNFTHSVHGFVGIITEEMTIILRKGNIQKPMHGFDLPMLPSQFHQLFGRDDPAGNVVTGFLTKMSTSFLD